MSIPDNRVAKKGLQAVLLASLAYFAAAGSLLGQRPAQEPEAIVLWSQGAPGAVGSEDLDRPTITPYLPPADSSVGTGVIVCPGGGYAHLAMDHEGVQIARWLNSIGVAAFVLRYRLGPRYHHPAPLDDAQRALRYVRLHADEFHIDVSRLGIWGFSAGGHLASTAATHFDRGNPAAAEAIDRMSSRPDFAILAYPVITMTGESTHKGSRRNLLGENPEPQLMELLSNEKQVTAETPPTFLFHTNEDQGVPAENSVLFYMALRKAGVPAEIHIYQRGRHGVGLAPTDLALSSWPRRLADWLYSGGLLAAPRP
jgi:acetyl esterase/lipase